VGMIDADVGGYLATVANNSRLLVGDGGKVFCSTVGCVE
jgi:hypothetical protein